MRLGHRIQQGSADKLVQKIEAVLARDAPQFVCSINSLKPLVDRLVVTETRLLAVQASGGVVKWDVTHADIKELLPDVQWKELTFVMSDGSSMKFGVVHPDDQQRIAAYLMGEVEPTVADVPSVVVAVQEEPEAEDASAREHEIEKAARLEAKRSAKTARAEVKRAQQQTKREQAELARQKADAEHTSRRALQVAQERKLQEKVGRRTNTETFASRKIEVFANGYVRIAGAFSAGRHEKLLAITADRAVQEKSAGGRALASAATMGVSKLYSTETFKTFLTIVTDSQTYSLQSEGAGSYKSALTLATTGTAFIQASRETQTASQAETPAPETSLTGQLGGLAALHKNVVLNDEEFAAAKAKLLGAG